MLLSRSSRADSPPYCKIWGTRGFLGSQAALVGVLV